MHAEIKLHADLLGRNELTDHSKRQQGNQQARRGKHADGGQLAAENFPARYRIGEQRFERLPLAFACSEIDRKIHPTHENGDDEKVRQHGEHQHGP